MILIVHDKGRKVVQVFRDAENLAFSADPGRTLWKLAREFPEEILVWVEQEFHSFVQQEYILEPFKNDLIMASYAINSKFLPGSIGYVDQLPFINVTRGVKYPTWRMSSDIGGIKGEALLKFEPLFKNIRNFDLLLNSVAKLGQQNGLFCYSDPSLLDKRMENKPVASAGNTELFSFVYSHYKSVWVFVLFFCLVRYERTFPIMALIRSFFRKKMFGKNVKLPEINNSGQNEIKESRSVDVVIPTIGRPAYIKQVVEDLSDQTLLPKKVIIVEQNPDPELVSELSDLLETKWPFEIVHLFTHQTGACMARNRALSEVKSTWTFFADDDIRIPESTLEQAISEAERLGADCINLNCQQEGEETIFKKVKQWGSFGSGTSIVRSQFVKQLTFSEIFEHGYGEDADFGIKLRCIGCDIIYHPNIVIQHLKAPVGGFRKKPVLPWEQEKPGPKPSPTLMVMAKRYYTPRQMKGFKISLYLKYFRKQGIKNPIRYIKRMEFGWKRSENWAEELEKENMAYIESLS